MGGIDSKREEARVALATIAHLPDLRAPRPLVRIPFPETELIHKLLVCFDLVLTCTRAK